MDWKRFPVHGNAVHDALIELVLPDTAKRSRAFQSLNQHMELGGAPLRHLALPFLVRLASDPRVHDRGPIIRLLNSLVTDPVVLADVIKNGEAFMRCLDLDACSHEAIVLLASCQQWPPLSKLLEGPPNDARTLALWCTPLAMMPKIRHRSPIDQVILWLASAQDEELSLAIRREIEQVASDTFFALHRKVVAADGFFPDLMTRIQSMQPKTRWSMLEGILSGVGRGLAIDVLTSRMIDVFLPASASSFEELPYEARALVSKFVASRQPWLGSHMQRKLKRAGLPTHRAKVVEELKLFGPMQVAVILPELHSSTSVEIAEQVGAPFWRGAPFVLYLGDISHLGPLMPPQAGEFPDQITTKSKQMAELFYAKFVYLHPARLRHAVRSDNFGPHRFYPHQTRENLLRIFARNHWRVVEFAEPIPTQSSAAGDRLRAQGWQDVECWQTDHFRLFAKYANGDENAWLSVCGETSTLALGDESVHDCLMVILKGKLNDIIDVVTTGPLRRLDARRLIELGKKKGLVAGLRLSKTQMIQF